MKLKLMKVAFAPAILLSNLSSLSGKEPSSPFPLFHPLLRHSFRRTTAGNVTMDKEGNNKMTHNWWELGMADSVLDEVALYFLGQAWYQNSDVSEVLETMYRVNQSDPYVSWPNEWFVTADRMETLGTVSEADGHFLSAGKAYLRGATYRRAGLFRYPDPYDPEVALHSQRAVDAFNKYLALVDSPCKEVKIPYEDTSLPAYLCTAYGATADTPAPTIIFHEGKDGWAEDGKYIADEALLRGYNTLLIDGPGIGKTLRMQQLPFRHDWENVIAPVIDYLVGGVPEADPTQLVLMGVSLGGYLAPRAAVYEHRLKALIANPGVMDWFQIYLNLLKEIDVSLPKLLEDDPDAFDSYMYQIMDASTFFQWAFTDSCWHHGVQKPHELMYEISKFKIDPEMAANITAHTLIIDAEAEERGQAKELYEALTGAASKAYVYFTAKEAAQFHVQIGATAILCMRVFDWLDDILFDEHR